MKLKNLFKKKPCKHKKVISIKGYVELTSLVTQVGFGVAMGELPCKIIIETFKCRKCGLTYTTKRLELQ